MLAPNGGCPGLWATAPAEQRKRLARALVRLLLSLPSPKAAAGEDTATEVEA